MFQYRKYNIRITDQFRADDYPKMVNELSDLSNGIAGLPDLHKQDIIVSFLKNHIVTNEWVTANPELTGLISSKRFETTHLESLFDSSGVNTRFTEELEDFVRKNV